MEIYDRFINIIYKENYYRKDGTSNFKGVINQDIPKFSGAHNRIPAWKYILSWARWILRTFAP